MRIIIIHLFSKYGLIATYITKKNIVNHPLMGNPHICIITIAVLQNLRVLCNQRHHIIYKFEKEKLIIAINKIVNEPETS